MVYYELGTKIMKNDTICLDDYEERHIEVWHAGESLVPSSVIRNILGWEILPETQTLKVREYVGYKNPYPDGGDHHIEEHFFPLSSIARFTVVKFRKGPR